jgi:hypothetical protein
MRRLIMSALVAACLAPLPGSTLQQLSLNDMIAKSTAIVYGTVQPTYTAFRGSMIYSHYRVNATNTYKGPTARFLDLAVPGGETNGVRQSFAGAPTLNAGHSYLLFLWTSKTGLTQVIGLSQGLFNITTDSGGNLVVSRGATNETMLNSNGQLVSDGGMQMTLTQMRSKIHSVLSGVTAQ